MAEDDLATSKQSIGEASDSWERRILIRLAFAGLDEQRRARRWNLFFKALGLAYLTVLLVLFLDLEYAPTHRVGKHTALVDIQGIITEGTEASADNVVDGLRDAFKDKKTAGVVVRINSPGGSPVQSRYINKEIRRLREKHPDIPVYAVISDLCASGGYYVAVAADKIFADESSVVGSIGVRMDSFGFVEAIRKLGVERRLLTAGDHKALLDPFLPADPLEKAHLQTLLDAIHIQFIEAVKEGRGDRLGGDETIFSGLVWTGQEALKLGLIDEFGSAGDVAREVIGEDTLVDFTPKKDLFDRLSGNVGAAIANSLGSLLGVAGNVPR